VASSAVQPILALLSSEPGANPMQYMIEQAFAHHGLDWRYLTLEVTPENLPDAIGGMRAMGFHGGHCGQPHKRAVLPLVDRLTETAEIAGAANILFRDDDALVGDNTEGQGLVECLRRKIDLTEKCVVLLGAGGAARAVAIELARAGAAEIVVVNRTEQRAAALAGLLGERFSVAATAEPWNGDYHVPDRANVLIHATSLAQGDSDSLPPLDLESLRPELLVADMTLDAPHTRLLDEAHGRGCAVIDGLDSHIEQTALALQLWTNVDPDREIMREAIEEFLEL